MSRKKPSSKISAQAADSQVLEFVSRAQQLCLRGSRNYSRYKLLTKGFVAADSVEPAQWRREDAQESQRDAEWKRRHGAVAGGAKLLALPVKSFGHAPIALAPPSTEAGGDAG